MSEPPDFYPVPSWAARHKALSSPAKLLVGVIAYYERDAATSTPSRRATASRDTLAAAIGVHWRTVRRLLDELEAHGVLEVTPGRGRGHLTTYRLVRPKDDGSATVSPKNKGGDRATVSAEKVARVEAEKVACDESAPLPAEPDGTDLQDRTDARAGATTLGLVLRTFGDAWKRKTGDAWMGVGKHRDRLDRIAAQVADRHDGEAWIEASIAGFFESDDPFLAKTRWSFATWSSDPGRYVPARVEPVGAPRFEVLRSAGGLTADEERETERLMLDLMGGGEPTGAALRRRISKAVCQAIRNAGRTPPPRCANEADPAWARLEPFVREEAARTGRTLDVVCERLAVGFAHDERTRTKGYPLSWLAETPGEYLGGHAAPSSFAHVTVSALEMIPEADR